MYNVTIHNYDGSIRQANKLLILHACQFCGSNLYVF